MTRPAPPLDCAWCGRRIGKTASHHPFPDRHAVLCSRCVLNDDVHRAWWPDCHEPGHKFPADHHPGGGTRAGAAWVLGLWGKQP